MSEHWYILGAGAIGCLWAKWLTPHSSLLVNPDSNLVHQFVDLKKSQPIFFEFETKDQHETIAIPCTLTSTVFDIQNLLICTKANQTKAAIKNLSLASHARVVLLQNGMGNQELLERHFPGAKIFCGSTTHGAFRKNNQHIVHAGLGETYLGSVPDSTDSSEIENAIKALSNPFEKVQLDTQMEKRLWKKLAINCAINPLTVIYKCQNGGLLEKSESKAQLDKISLELDLVLQKKGFLSKDEKSYPVIEKVIKDTAQNYSSMYQDFLNKRPTEIDFIQGYFCQEAKKLGIDTPENLNVLHIIKEIEASY